MPEPQTARQAPAPNGTIRRRRSVFRGMVSGVAVLTFAGLAAYLIWALMNQAEPNSEAAIAIFTAVVATVGKVFDHYLPKTGGDDV